MNTGNKPRRGCAWCKRTVAHGATTGHALPHNCPHGSPCFGGLTGARRESIWGQCAACFSEAVEAAIAQEAGSLMLVHETNPTDWPEGRSLETATAAACERVTARFQNGRCGLCYGPAVVCAWRHSKGRSCA